MSTRNILYSGQLDIDSCIRMHDIHYRGAVFVTFAGPDPEMDLVIVRFSTVEPRDTSGFIHRCTGYVAQIPPGPFPLQA